MRISIIGGAGRMGQWLTQHFHSLGHSIIVSDPLNKEQIISPLSEKVSVAGSNVSAVEDADAVILSVPIENIIEVIREVAPHMKENSTLCEISSVKGKIPDVLKECVVYNVSPLCIHPMFGPGSFSRTKKFILLPIVDPETELNMVKTLFPECQIVIATPEDHDRAMAITISLPYFVNMVIASVLVDEDLSLLQRLGGSTFALQFLLTSSVMSNAPCLHGSMHIANEHSIDILKKFESLFHKSVNTLTQNIDDFVESYKALQGHLAEIVDLNQKYVEMYDLLETMNQLSNGEGGFP